MASKCLDWAWLCSGPAHSRCSQLRSLLSGNAGYLPILSVRTKWNSAECVVNTFKVTMFSGPQLCPARNRPSQTDLLTVPNPHRHGVGHRLSRVLAAPPTWQCYTWLRERARVCRDWESLWGCSPPWSWGKACQVCWIVGGVFTTLFVYPNPSPRLCRDTQQSYWILEWI